MNTTIKINFKPLKRSDITFFKKQNILFSSDFRETAESQSFKIDEMRSYENYAFLLTCENDVTVVTNNSYQLESMASKSKPAKLYVAKDIDDPRISVYDRINPDLKSNITSLYAAVPNRSADSFAIRHGIEIIESFENYLSRNNKITQKRLLKDLTPKWSEIDLSSVENLTNIKKTAVLKRDIGSGGYTVFFAKDRKKVREAIKLAALDDSHKWYQEERVKGEPYSAQAWCQNGEITFFGYGHQITEGTTYTGSTILPFITLQKNTKNFLTAVMKNLTDILFDYTGFIGVDFMLDQQTNKYFALECNVRMTSASLPTLITNEQGTRVETNFIEFGDVDDKSVDARIGIVPKMKIASTLTFSTQSNFLGTNIYLLLSSCKNLEQSLDESTIEKLKNIIESNVSSIVNYSYHNFWPYGWTLSFILAESHCVLSSWYKEKTVTVDVFCCKDFNYGHFSQEVCSYFSGAVSKKEVSKRSYE
jgi:S-adenosylmethionine/arginine decarboxylase-like enzyme